jgi:hypothetical protein
MPADSDTTANKPINGFGRQSLLKNADGWFLSVSVDIVKDENHGV